MTPDQLLKRVIFFEPFINYLILQPLVDLCHETDLLGIKFHVVELVGLLQHEDLLVVVSLGDTAWESVTQLELSLNSALFVVLQGLAFVLAVGFQLDEIVVVLDHEIVTLLQLGAVLAGEVIYIVG